MKNFILATAGHVDHGKSALVKALTGTDPDRLPEEKDRGITIELGFAQLALPDAIVGIVDVPGHEDFVKNMVAGVGSIDLALIVVAADDGWMPQTEEHLQILTYLGVKRAVVAVTKIDLAKSEDAAESEVRAKLVGTPFQDAPIARTSVTTLRGIDELKELLAREFAPLDPQPDIGKPRLALDRAFTLHGIGTVVTGTLTGGIFRRGDAITLQPAKIPARIRTIQNHGHEVEQIGPGARTALNLSDAPVAHGKSERGVSRGDVVTLAELGDASAIIDALITRSTRLPPKTRPLKHGVAVRVHHGSGNYEARVFFADERELRVGDSNIAQLRFDTPVFMFAGDRFVVRDSSEQSTLAGGIVLDPDASVTNFREDAQQEFLKTRSRSPDSVHDFVSTQLARDHYARRAEVLLKARFSQTAIASGISDLSERGIVVESGELVLEAKWWTQVRALAISAIEQEHSAHSNRPGLELTRLRSILAVKTTSPEVFEALITELSLNGFVRSADVIRRATHRLALPAPLQEAGVRIRSAIRLKPFDPPSRKQLTPDMSSQQALRFFIETRQVIEISEDIVLDADAFVKMRDEIVAFISLHGPSTLSQLREELHSTRRVMVPFLERLDCEGVTRRIGDKRSLCQNVCV